MLLQLIHFWLGMMLGAPRTGNEYGKWILIRKSKLSFGCACIILFSHLSIFQGEGWWWTLDAPDAFLHRNQSYTVSGIALWSKKLGEKSSHPLFHNPSFPLISLSGSGIIALLLLLSTGRWPLGRKFSPLSYGIFGSTEIPSSSRTTVTWIEMLMKGPLLLLSFWQLQATFSPLLVISLLLFAGSFQQIISSKSTQMALSLNLMA